MADPRRLTILIRNRDEIESAIKAYEKKIVMAKRDLSSVNATMRLSKLDGDLPSSRHTSIRPGFQSWEIATLCKAALAEEGPLRAGAAGDPGQGDGRGRQRT